MYFNLFIRQQNYNPILRHHYLIWDPYRSKKAAKEAVKFYPPRYYTYVKTVSVPSIYSLDDDITMARFPVTSYHTGRITYDK